MSPISLGFFYLGDILFILLYLFLWSQSKNKEMRSLFFIIIKTSHIVLVLGKVGSSLYQNLDNSDKGSFFSSLEEEKNERDKRKNLRIILLIILVRRFFLLTAREDKMKRTIKMSAK